MSRKKAEQELIREIVKRTKKKSAVRKAVDLAVGTGLCAGAGVMVGIANYFYDFSMKPIRRDTSHERAEDGLRIHANYIPSPVKGGDHRFALCVHGYSDSAESMGVYAMVYRDVYGMNVVMPDLRGHGKSEGTYVGYGYHERRDIIIWIDRILQIDPEAVIILHGISMGAATVMMVTGEKLPSNVKACIEDSGFSTAMEEFAHVFGTLKKKPPISSDFLLPILKNIGILRAGYNLNDASPLDAVKRSITPTLFIHGEADSFIPCSMMTKLFEAASCEKMCMLVPKAEHVKSVVQDPEGYWAKIESFLKLVDPQLVERKA